MSILGSQDLDSGQDQLDQPSRSLFSFVLPVAALVVGIAVGVLISWALWPIPQDLAPVDLHTGYRDFYLALVANEYSITHKLDDAKIKLGADNPGDAHPWSSKDIAAALRKLAESPNRADRAQLETLAADLERSPAVLPTPVSGSNWLLGAFPTWLIAICGVLLLVVLGLVGWLIVWPRLSEAGAGARPQSAAVRSAQASKRVEPTTTWSGATEKPLAQFVTSYEVGDDRYDTSFPIEAGANEFLGECGVGISETIGVGSPDKVTAFEVWLFDKTSIATVTKVLLSEFAYNDAALRTKLAPKGEPVLAQPDAAIELETNRLKIRARVVDMDYGTGELQPQSFFSKLSLELAVWPRAGAAAPTA